MARDMSVMRMSFTFRAPDWCADLVDETIDHALCARIDGICDRIRQLWQDEIAQEAAPEAGSLANDRLRERVYFMMFWLREVGSIDAARAHMRRAGRRGRRPKSDAASSFVDALHHVFRDEGPSAQAVSSQSRPRIARELAYALHHNIPPVLLLPFLRHATQAEILRRQKMGLVEAWLDSDTAA